MNLQQWQQICTEVTAQRQPLRVDCLNPFSALEQWRLIDNEGEAYAQELELGFRATLELPDRNCVLTRGVRSLLRTLMNSSTGKSHEWLLPSDVYPAYQNLARDTGINFTTYSTWPDLRLDALLTQNSMSGVFLLLPVPHSPTGRLPTVEEVGLLLQWTAKSRTRFLLLDLVYAYDHINDPRLRQLASSEQTILAFSTSKTWLQRCLAGVAVVPKALTAELQAMSERPDWAARRLAVRCLEEQKDLPARQAAKFEQQWQLLTETLRQADPSWSPPTNGYLSVVNCSWQRMLEAHNLLAVPPSLFGSQMDSYAIVSCLQGC